MVTGLTHPLHALFSQRLESKRGRKREAVLVLAPGCPCLIDTPQSASFHKPVRCHAHTGFPNMLHRWTGTEQAQPGLQNGPLFRHSGRAESPIHTTTPETLSLSHNRPVWALIREHT